MRTFGACRVVGGQPQQVAAVGGVHRDDDVEAVEVGGGELPAPMLDRDAAPGRLARVCSWGDSPRW